MRSVPGLCSSFLFSEPPSSFTISSLRWRTQCRTLIQMGLYQYSASCGILFAASCAEDFIRSVGSHFSVQGKGAERELCWTLESGCRGRGSRVLTDGALHLDNLSCCCWETSSGMGSLGTFLVPCPLPLFYPQLQGSASHSKASKVGCHFTPPYNKQLGAGLCV